MAKTRRSLHTGGETSACALLLVDVINAFDFPGAPSMLRRAKGAATRVAALAARARKAGVPVVYVNDNFGKWRSDFRTLVDRCMDATSPGHEIARTLSPMPSDYFVLKPMNSGFYSTVLETLLRFLGVERVVLAGFATDNCVLFTAHDAHMRGYELFVPRDCSTGTTPDGHSRALLQMRRHLRARTVAGRSLDLQALARP